MALNIKVSSSDWIDLRTRGFVAGMYLLNSVGAPIEYSTAATPAPGTTLVGSSAVLITGTYLWVRGSGDCELYTATEWAAATAKTVPVMASTTSSGGIDKFDFARRTGAVAVVHSLGADSIGAASTAAQRLDYATIPAGSLKIGDVLRVTHARTKSGATDTSSALLRAGAANAVADGVLASLPGLGTTATSAGTIMEFKITSETTIRQLGATNGNTSLSGTSTGAIYADKTIPNISSSDLFIGLYDTMTSGAEYITLGTFSVEYIPQVA